MATDGRKLDHQTLEVMRHRAIDAHEDGNSVNGIANMLGLHRGSVSRWITLYSRRGKSGLKSRKAPGPKRKLDCNVYGKRILKIVKNPASKYNFENPLWNCKRIQKVVKDKLGVKVSVPTIWRGLKLLNFSSQKPERRAVEQDPVKREKWLREEWPKIKAFAKKRKAIIFFEDEAGVKLTPTVGRSWGIKGERPIIQVTGKRGGVCAMSAVSPSGKLFFSIPRQRVNSDVFIEFLEGLLREYPRRQIVVIADQASAHTSKKTKAFVVSQKRLALFYLPPYSPDYNPDEHAWDHLKNHALKAHSATTSDELARETRKQLRRMSQKPDLVRSFFHRTVSLKL